MRSTSESNSSACPVDLAGKTIILGVTGGIAAYKAAYLASSLTQRGASVHVVMTEHATKLVGPATFWSLTGQPVLTGMFEPPTKPEITHVSLPESADLLLIAPATANMIGKLANGIADDMLSTMALVAKCPFVICPAMNANMYTNAFVAANLERLRQRGYTIVEPDEGRLACGSEGVGRLAEPEKILRAVEETLLGTCRDYVGLNVIVTAGPTREAIDPVRFITNRSSGRMGYAIAEAAAQRGAKVTLVSGPTVLNPPVGVDVIRVDTVQEMFVAVNTRVTEADLLISAAAPADFTPSKISDQKIKKTEKLTLEFAKAVDILGEIGQRKGRTVLVGFAAETTDLEKHAEEKLKSKNLDVIVANDVSAGSRTFGSDTNEVTIISRNGDRLHWPRMSKHEVANEILEYVKNNFLQDASYRSR